MFSGKRVKPLTPYLLILPAVLAMLLVHFFPIIWGVMISFRDLDIFTISNWTKAPFVGLDNFRWAFSFDQQEGQNFLRSLYNIVLYGSVTISLGYVIALAVAILLNQKFFGRTIVRGLVLLPYIMPDSDVILPSKMTRNPARCQLWITKVSRLDL
jgi:multiple sugar transport system permease protein